MCLPPEEKPKPVSLDTTPVTTGQLSQEDDSDEIEYFALLMDSHKIGYAVQKRIVDEDIVKTSIEMSLTLNRSGVSVSITTKSSTETKDGKPLGFENEQNLSFLTTKTVGTIDENGKLSGVFTDGDLRRTMDHRLDVHTARVGEVMTAKCKSIHPGMLAAEALQIMDATKINALPLINENDELVGALNMHNLLKAGVV